MSDKEPQLKINDILALLDNANSTLNSTINLPSVPDNILVLPLNANHTKNIVRSVTSGLFSDTQFNLIFFQILSEVVKFPLANLNILDKAVLALKLRSKNISDNIQVDLRGTVMSEEGKKTEFNVTEKISINNRLNLFSFDKTWFDDRVVECDEYNIILNYPSIVDEYQFDDHLYKNKLSTVAEDNKTALKNLVAPIFLYNIAQYIKGIVIGENSITLKGKTINERLAIVEKLSANSINKVIETIDSEYGKALNEITSVIVTKDDVEYTGTIKIGAEMFISN